MIAPIDLDTLCRDGFARRQFQVDELWPAAVDATQRLFALPHETLAEYSQPKWGGMVGYQLGDRREIYGTDEQVTQYWHFIGDMPGGPKNTFPQDDIAAPIQALFDAYDQEAATLTAEISEALGRPGVLSSWIKGAYRMLRLIRYPEGPATLDSAVRASEHDDAGILTLYRGGSTPGLELQRPDGVWERSEPGQGIVAAGELLKLLTGGMVRPGRHRVQYGRSSAPERISLPFFLTLPLDLPLEPLVEGVDGDWRGQTFGDFLRERTGWDKPSEPASPQGKQ